MDQKLAEILERNRVERELRKSAATPATEQAAVAEPAVTAPVREKKKKAPFDARRNDFYHRVRLGEDF